VSDAANALDSPFAARRRLLVGMGIIALTLAGLVYATVLRRLDEPPKLAQGSPVLRFSPQQVSQVEVHYRRKEFRLSRDGAGWRIEDPTGSAAVPDDRVDDFLEVLSGLVRLVPIGKADEVPLADFGLEPPRGEVILRRASQEDIRLRLGNRNGPLTGMYIEVMRDREVALVGAVLLLEVEKLAALASEEADDAVENNAERNGA
jgi:hypothetical protein